MAKAKAKAVIRVADGFGGMVRVTDQRFEQDWPVSFDIPNEKAGTWLLYLSDEIEKRGLSASGIGQLEATESSGSQSIRERSTGTLKMTVVWERKRDRPMRVRARSETKSGTDEVRAFLDRVTERQAQGATSRFFQAWHLCYDGLPWRGELWLNDALLLAPPSQQYERAKSGPRAVLVYAMVDGINLADARSTFEIKLRELSVFLSVIMGRRVGVSRNGGTQAWTWSAGPDGHAECDVRQVGYSEPRLAREMPRRGEADPIPLEPVKRPHFPLAGIDSTRDEVVFPSDILDLWTAFERLAPEKRRQFLQAGNLWQAALSLAWPDYKTTRFALMVGACEALKPLGPEYKEHNIYHVVEGLLGAPYTAKLREDWFRPQDVRNAHLHRGEFRGSEFAHNASDQPFHDPTFDEATSVLGQITQAALIAWLGTRGSPVLPPLEERRSWRRAFKRHSMAAIALGVGVGAGLLLGSLLR